MQNVIINKFNNMPYNKQVIIYALALRHQFFELLHYLHTQIPLAQNVQFLHHVEAYNNGRATFPLLPEAVQRTRANK